MSGIEGARRTAPMLEVIACSVADAVEAEQGGAGRLEVISRFDVGGLTPPLDLVRDIMAAVRLPVRVILRESLDYAVTDAAEVARLCAAAQEFAGLGVDGLVLGFLRHGEADLELTARILACAPPLSATFHHAFEETRDPLAAIGKLKQLGQIDRILTAGGTGDWPQRIGRLAAYEQEARPELTILVGGGLDAAAIRPICKATGIGEFHVGRAARTPATSAGAVQAARVRELVRILEESCTDP
ncbi:MAG TPA: copper homeostasis protein CutC [Blastocatellia bacterium]|nr:copper homeostasis protein CutC [Blastocatellia bacterium]